MQPPRAIVFDTFGTLVDWRGSLIDACQALGGERGIEADWARLVDGWRAAYRPSMDRVRRGELPWTPLDGLHRASLDGLLDDMALPLAEADRARLTHCWHELRAWPDSAAGIARLHARCITGPLSNGNVALLVDLARANGFRWDMVFGADVFGHYKPDPETYLGVCRLLDLPPGEVMLCAAHNDDLGAAQSHGLQTAFIPRPQEYGPAQRRDVRPEGEWTVAAESVEALAGRFGL